MRHTLTPPKQIASLEQLQHTANCIQLNSQTITKAALEELMIHRRARNLVADLGKFFDNVSSYLDEKVAGFSNRKIDIKPSKIEKALTEKKYTDLSELHVPVIPGMSVDWITMLDVLEFAAVASDELYDQTLYPFSQFIGQILNNPDKLQSASLRPDIRMHDLEAIKTKLGRAMSMGNKDTARFGKVFRRNADVTEVTARLHKLVENHNRNNTKMIADTVKDLDRNLEALMKKIQDPNEPYRMTPQKVQELSKICYALANEITAYSVYTVTLEAAVNAMNKTVTAVEKY